MVFNSFKRLIVRGGAGRFRVPSFTLIDEKFTPNCIFSALPLVLEICLGDSERVITRTNVRWP